MPGSQRTPSRLHCRCTFHTLPVDRPFTDLFMPCGSSLPLSQATSIVPPVRHSLSCVSILAKVSTPDLGEHSRRSQPFTLPAERRPVYIARHLAVASFTDLFMPCGSSFHCAGHFYECVSLSCVRILAKVSTPDLGEHSRRSPPFTLPAERRPVYIARHLAVASFTDLFMPCGSSFHCAGHFYECVSLSCVSILAKVSTPDLGEHSCRSQLFTLPAERRPSHWIVIHCAGHFYECLALCPAAKVSQTCLCLVDRHSTVQATSMSASRSLVSGY